MITFNYQTNSFAMPQGRIIFLWVLTQIVTITAAAQRNDTAAAVVNVQINDNEVNFNPALRPLRQIAGAPEAFYSYFWEFGDGSFSFEQSPLHSYKDTGFYDVRLFATNNYDDGKPPPTRPKPIKVSRRKPIYASNKGSGFFKEGGALEMKVNRMPRPGEDLVLVIGYRNADKSESSGSLILFYNEKQFRNENFQLSEERTYGNEQKTTLRSVIAYSSPEELIRSGDGTVLSGPQASGMDNDNHFYRGKFSELIASRQKLFRQNNAWKFSNLGEGEEKYFFITLHTNEEMIKDTNAVVVLNGMLVPDGPSGEIEEFSLELQIVASHDPNRMMLRNQRMNYRFTGKQKDITYKVQFQNTGKGPSRTISVGVNVPQMLDPRSLEILDFRPRALFCDSAYQGQSCMDTIIGKDSIWFIFKNIYLPGLRQEGFSDIDSTIGFVKYRLHFSRALKKLPFESGAVIVFDENEPIRTNGAKGHFQPGNSPAIILGYNKTLGGQGKGNRNGNYWLFGGSLSPFSPYKRYFQGELYFGFLNNPEQLVDQVQNKDTTINSQLWRIIYRNTYAKSKLLLLELVALQVRYNFLDLLGGGVGTQFSFDARAKTSFRKEMLLQPPGPGVPMEITNSGEKTTWFNSWDLALFADVQFGKVRLGPVLGLRYLHYFRVPQNRLFAYAAWRL